MVLNDNLESEERKLRKESLDESTLTLNDRHSRLNAPRINVESVETAQEIDPNISQDVLGPLSKAIAEPSSIQNDSLLLTIDELRQRELNI